MLRISFLWAWWLYESCHEASLSLFLIAVTPSLPYSFPVFSACSRNFSLVLFGCKTSLSHSPLSTFPVFWQLSFISSYVQTSCGVQSLCPPPWNTSNISPSPTSPWKPTSITVPIRNGWRWAVRWQIGPADISEAEVTGMQRFSLDKPLLLWLWPSPQSSLVLSAWKSYDSVFLCKKKLSETETVCFKFFYFGRKNLFYLTRMCPCEYLKLKYFSLEA